MRLDLLKLHTSFLIDILFDQNAQLKLPQAFVVTHISNGVLKETLQLRLIHDDGSGPD